MAVGWRCRQTALHLASLNGHTETAKALVAAGVDVHRQDNNGYGSGVCRMWGYPAERVCSTTGPEGRGEARSLARRWLWAGGAGVRRCKMRLRMGTRRRRRRWWRRARTCTGKTTMGTVGGVSHVGLAWRARLLDDRSRGQGRGVGQIARAAMGLGLRCTKTALQYASWAGDAGKRRFTLRRLMGTRRRRRRWWRRARTCTARTIMGTVGGVSHVGLSWRARLLDDRSRGQGRGVGQIARAAVSVGWWCRESALYLASILGHTEMAKALVAAGADVHRQNNDGYGRGCVACGAILVSASARRQVPGAGARRRADRSRGNGRGLAMQAHCAARCVFEWAHGDGEGAGGGGRGRALRRQRWVRSGVCRMWG